MLGVGRHGRGLSPCLFLLPSPYHPLSGTQQQHHVSPTADKPQYKNSSSQVINKGVMGTIQFAGMATGISRQNGSSGKGGVSSGRSWKRKPFGFGKGVETDKVVSLPKEERKSLLDEISSVGPAVLKHTNRPAPLGALRSRLRSPRSWGTVCCSEHS